MTGRRIIVFHSEGKDLHKKAECYDKEYKQKTKQR
jgi:hypothetical protein